MSAPGTDSEVPEHVRVEYGKWDGRPHYRLSMAWLGEDEYGVWLWAPAGNLITKGDDITFHTNEATLGLVPRQGLWSAVWWEAHPDIELYVDINTSPEWDAGDRRVSMIDLDLDVAQFVDGRVEVLDRDEFDEHRVAYGYPPDVVDAAARAADELHALVAAGTEPFGGVMQQRWLAEAGARASARAGAGVRAPARPKRRGR